MDIKIIVAFIGVLSSILVAILSAILTVRNDRKLERIKGDIAASKSIKDARLDYEYEAKKNLYKQYEPLKFQLFEYAELALGRLKGISINYLKKNQKYGLILKITISMKPCLSCLCQFQFSI